MNLLLLLHDIVRREGGIRRSCLNFTSKLVQSPQNVIKYIFREDWFWGGLLCVETCEQELDINHEFDINMHVSNSGRGYIPKCESKYDVNMHIY